MKILFEGNIPKVAQVEALLIMTGKMVMDDKGRKLTKGRVVCKEVGSNILPWREQRGFRSPVFTRTYLLTTDNRLPYFCRYFRTKFFYNQLEDYANMQVPTKEADKLKFLVEQCFNLFQQEQPEDAERIRKLSPKGVLDELKRIEVSDNGGNPE